MVIEWINEFMIGRIFSWEQLSVQWSDTNFTIFGLVSGLLTEMSSLAARDAGTVPCTATNTCPRNSVLELELNWTEFKYYRPEIFL